MNTLLKLEMIVLVLLAVWLFSLTEFAWWWFVVLFLVPDIGMVGYVAGPKAGAWTYNLTHHMGLATLSGFSSDLKFKLLKFRVFFAYYLQK